MAAPEKYVCAKCGRSIRSATRPLLQSTGKCPKATNGNHSWHKETGNGTQVKYVCLKCGRSTRSATKPLLQSTGKCPKATNGNHSWHKES